MAAHAPDDFAQLEELFHAALRFDSAADRTAFLDAACAGAPSLRERVESLLRADGEQTGGGGPRPGLDSALPRFGVFQAERVLGRGGTGTVYLAKRTDGQFDQLAAVKVVAWELSDERVRDGFLSERQILAGLTHPGIAQVLDGGVLPNGAPYLVMEYVDGAPLDAHCRQGRLGLRERIALLLSVCDAVAFAHRNLVVHLDLKPSNILVSTAGHVKVLDFGTAKALAGPDAAVTQRIGTPLYASPEQLRGDRAGIAADVFALGVIAAELLAGVWPFGDPTSGLHRARRALEDVDSAPLATKVTEADAAERGVSLAQLRRALTGDLDAIVRKAIQSDPAARYTSVDEFAADLRAYIEGRPVQARRAGQLYVARKFVRRHRALVSLSVAAVVGMAATTAVALRERRIADQHYAGLRELTRSMLFELKDAIRDLPGATEAQRILASRVLNNLDRIQASSNDPALRFDMAECYRQLGELQGDPYVPNLGDAKSAIESLGKAERIVEAELSRSPRDDGWLWLAGLVQQNIGEVYFGQNDPRAAADRLRRATAYFDRMVGITKDRVRYADGATGHGVLADVLGSPGLSSLFDSAGARAEYTRAIDLDEQGLRQWPDYVRLRRGIALMRSKRSDLLRQTDPAKALEDVDLSLQKIDKLDRAERERPTTVRIWAMIQIKRAEILGLLGRWEPAREAISDVLALYRKRAEADPKDERAQLDVVTTTGKLLELAYTQPGSPGALAIADKAVPLWQGLIRKEPAVLIYRSELATAEAHRAVLLHRSGRSADAKSQAARARLDLQAVLGDPKAGQFERQRCSAALGEIREI